MISFFLFQLLLLTEKINIRGVACSVVGLVSVRRKNILNEDIAIEFVMFWFLISLFWLWIGLGTSFRIQYINRDFKDVRVIVSEHPYYVRKFTPRQTKLKNDCACVTFDPVGPSSARQLARKYWLEQHTPNETLDFAVKFRLVFSMMKLLCSGDMS